MNKQLQAIQDELDAATARLHRLAGATPETRWAKRADPARWSVAECVAHLNLTSRAYIPIIRDALRDGRAFPLDERQRYRRDPMGWLVWRTMSPPVRFVRTKTKDSFVPAAPVPRADAVAEFERLQAEIGHELREANGLPLRRLRVASPFDARVRYNLYSCFSILARHQHRHLWQAERVWGASEG